MNHPNRIPFAETLDLAKTVAVTAFSPRGLAIPIDAGDCLQPRKERNQSMFDTAAIPIPASRLCVRDQHEPLSRDVAQALNFILPLSPDYPGIESWFRGKVVPGLRDGSRYVVRVERHGKLAGLGIGKRTSQEKKICTVRIAPDYVGRGIGVRIFDDLLKWLDTDKPHLTVGQHKLTAFERLFDWYGFKMTKELPGLYIPSKTELFFNELIDHN